MVPKWHKALYGRILKGLDSASMSSVIMIRSERLMGNTEFRQTQAHRNVCMISSAGRWGRWII